MLANFGKDAMLAQKVRVKDGNKVIVRAVYLNARYGFKYFKYDNRNIRIYERENGEPYAQFFNSVEYL